MKKMLYLSHRIPFPPDKGDKIRSYNQLAYFSNSFQVFLGTTLRDDAEYAYVGQLRRYCTEIFAPAAPFRANLAKGFLGSLPFSVYYFYSPQLQHFVDACLNQQDIDVIFCYSSVMAEYVFRSKAYGRIQIGKIKLIIDFVDLDSDKWKQYASYSLFPLKNLFYQEYKRLSSYELKILDIFDKIVFAAEREVKVLEKSYNISDKISIVPNGVDFSFFNSEPKRMRNESDCKRSGYILLFTGVMDYYANIDGVYWFCEEVLPIIKRAFPGIIFKIVGKNPTRKIKKLGQIKDVLVTGYVSDIRKYYWESDICVMPLRIARGIQNKVLEAMSTGNAVVATSNASDGIQCQHNRDIIVVDSSTDFANAVISLLEDDTKRKDLGKQATKSIQKNYSWGTHLQSLTRVLEQE